MFFVYGNHMSTNTGKVYYSSVQPDSATNK